MGEERSKGRDPEDCKPRPGERFFHLYQGVDRSKHEHESEEGRKGDRGEEEEDRKRGEDCGEESHSRARNLASDEIGDWDCCDLRQKREHAKQGEGQAGDARSREPEDVVTREVEIMTEGRRDVTGVRNRLDTEEMEETVGRVEVRIEVEEIELEHDGQNHDLDENSDGTAIPAELGIQRQSGRGDGEVQVELRGGNVQT